MRTYKLKANHLSENSLSESISNKKPTKALMFRYIREFSQVPFGKCNKPIFRKPSPYKNIPNIQTTSHDITPSKTS